MANPIKFRCFQCNQLLGVSRSKAGEVVSCPKCAAELIVPELGEVAPQLAAGTGPQGGRERRSQTARTVPSPRSRAAPRSTSWISVPRTSASRRAWSAFHLHPTRTSHPGRWNPSRRRSRSRRLRPGVSSPRRSRARRRRRAGNPSRLPGRHRAHRRAADPDQRTASSPPPSEDSRPASRSRDLVIPRSVVTA